MAEKYRQERIERLLHELRYEITRGMMEREIEEHLGYRFVVPISKHFARGVVECEFRTRPVPHMAFIADPEPRLKIVKSSSEPSNS